MSSYKNIFADKATIVLRKMLSNPLKRWVTRDFLANNELSIGMAQAVLETLSYKGYVERVKRGPASYSILTNKNELINDWVSEYKFEFNKMSTFYSHDKKILLKIRDLLHNRQYALTLHSGANLITSYVVTDHIYMYFNPDDWGQEILRLCQQLDLKQLVIGGNVHIINPAYKYSAFVGSRTIKGLKVVSNLQLYLDLYNFKPRGREHAEYLREYLLEKKISFYES